MVNSPSKRERDKKGRFKRTSRLPFVAKAPQGKDFPQIIRKITALVSWRLVVILLIVSLLLLNLVRFGQNLYTNFQEAQVKQGEKRALEAEVAKWEEVVRERPNYRDAYFELALLTYRLDRPYATRYYLKKVFALDPNFEPARELEKKLRY